MPEFGGVLRADRVGIAVSDPGRGEFVSTGTLDVGEGLVQEPHRFGLARTAGEWACEYECPVLGGRPAEMRRFSATFESICRDGFESNMVLPLKFGRFGAGAMYVLSRRPTAFGQNELAVAVRLRQVIEPAMQTFFAATELVEGRVDDEPFVGAVGAASEERARVATLAEVQREHIRMVLAESNNVIDGPRGAAAKLGMKASTLRHTIKRLRVKVGRREV